MGAPEFRDIAARLPGGLPYQTWAAELVENEAAEMGRDDPVAECRPAGALRLLTFPSPRKIIETPAEVGIGSERDFTYRQIFPTDDRCPRIPNGRRTVIPPAQWEGDRMVVETNGLRDGTWLDRTGNPLTDAPRLTERFGRLSCGRLEIELTIDESKAYTKPFTLKLNQLLAVDTELLACQDNENDAIHAIRK